MLHDLQAPVRQLLGGQLLQEYKIWGNRLEGENYGPILALVLTGDPVTTPNLVLELPDNVWGNARDRESLTIETWNACGKTTKLLVDPFRTSLPSQPDGIVPSPGVFRDNVFPDGTTTFFVDYGGAAHIEPCSPSSEILTGIERTTWGAVKARFR